MGVRYWITLTWVSPATSGESGGVGTDIRRVGIQHPTSNILPILIRHPVVPWRQAGVLVKVMARDRCVGVDGLEAAGLDGDRAVLLLERAFHHHDRS